MTGKTRSWWGWGNVEDAVSGSEREELTRRTAEMLPKADLTVEVPETPPPYATCVYS
ncbi:hypothetical protein ACWFRJ_05730 [Streptomyces sp. NPDC055239]